MKNIKKIAKEILSLKGYNYGPLKIMGDDIQDNVIRGFQRLLQGIDAIDEVKIILDREKAVKAELDADFKRLRKKDFETQLRNIKIISRNYLTDATNLKNAVDQLRNSIYTISK